MRFLEKLIASVLVITASAAVYAEQIVSVNEENIIKHPNQRQQRTRFSIRGEQVDREETIYLLTGADTDEEEARILEARLEAVKERLQGVSPECRGF